ncbi:LPXTG cell wall anchor domain-containing protein [Streptomyces sp. NPDC052682]|uniref:LPXTG cell wall anchor domain-containing protein n=1 Tax=Streptomyces sp. NPDC052682 TaxID=3154954 RepID=UPI0034471174
MRLCTPLSLCLAAAAALLPVATPVYAEPRPPACVAPDHRAFPLTTRLHGGPGSYPAGGGFGTFFLTLTNTTGRACTGIHPVVVLVDDERALKPSQPQLEFFVGARPHPVRFEATDQDELVGVLADDRDGFRGFTVGPGRTLTVRLRLAVTSDAVPNAVTAKAAVVQRQGDDGEWVGESNDYRFRIESEPEPRSSTEPQPRPRPDADASPGGTLPLADELARTGVSGPAIVTAGVLLLGAGGAVLVARRRR